MAEAEVVCLVLVGDLAVAVVAAVAAAARVEAGGSAAGLDSAGPAGC